MRFVRPLAIGFACVVLLLAAGAALGPDWIDWTRHRARVEAFVSARLGTPVRIEGPIGLTLLPSPVLRAEQVRIGPLGDGDAVRVRSVRMQLAFVPLLAGRMEARDLVLRQPALDLPWPPPVSVLSAARALRSDSLRARIEDGSITLGGLRLSGVEAAIAFDGGGVLSASGTLSLCGNPWHFNVRLGQGGPDGVMPIDAALDGREALAGVGATLSGRLTSDGELSGRAMARGPDLSRLADAPAVSFKADGDVAMRGSQVLATDLEFDLGGLPARGVIVADGGGAGRVQARLAANRFDLDRWAPFVGRASETARPVHFEFSSGAAAYAGGLLRDLHVIADLAAGSAAVRDLTVMLPGGTGLRFSGRLSAAKQPGAMLDIDGLATVSAPDLRSTLRWIGDAGWLGPDALFPSEVMRTAELSANVAGRADAVAFDGIAGTIDATPVGGTFAIKVGGRVPAVLADMSFGRVDLTPFLPVSWPEPEAGFAALQGIDADLALKAAEIDVRGQTVRDAALKMNLSGGRLDVVSMSGLWNGTRAEASGKADGVARAVALNAHARTEDGATAARALGFADVPMWHTPLSVTVSAKGGLDALGMSIGVDLGEARLEAQPTLDAGSGRWRGAVTLRHPSAWRLLQSAGLGGSVALPAIQDWLGDGSLAFSGQMAGERGRLTADNFGLTAGELRATGALAFTRANGRYRVAGRFAAESLPVPPLDLGSREPLPLAALSGWEALLQLSAGALTHGDIAIATHAGAILRVENGALSLSDGRAALGNGTISGNVVLNGTANPPTLSVQGVLAGLPIRPDMRLPLVAAGIADARADVAATGYSAAALRATLRGQASLHVRDGMLEGIDMPALNARLKAPDARADAGAFMPALLAGRAPFASADVEGQVTGEAVQLTDLRIISASGTISGCGRITIEGMDADLRLALRPDVPDAPAIGIRAVRRGDTLTLTPDLEAVVAWLNSRSAAPASYSDRHGEPPGGPRGDPQAAPRRRTASGSTLRLRRRAMTRLAGPASSARDE